MGARILERHAVVAMVGVLEKRAFYRMLTDMASLSLGPGASAGRAASVHGPTYRERCSARRVPDAHPPAHSPLGGSVSVH